jgi:hypothetical protein
VVPAALTAKSPRLAPLTPALRSIATDWWLVTVTVCGLLAMPSATAPKATLAGETVTALVPVPLRLTVCEPLAALSSIVSVPVRAPPTVGVKVTEMLQLFPAARLSPQLLVCPKSPVVVMPTMVSVVFPLLLSFTVFAAPVVPTGTDPNFSAVGEADAFGEGPGVGVAVGVGATVGVLVAVAVAVGVGVDVAVGEDVAVDVGVEVAVAVRVELAVAVAVAVTVGVSVAVAV